jgi:hypothetical protein
LFPAPESKASDAFEKEAEDDADVVEDTGDACDSDLFFDFDIGSPEPEPAEADDVDHVINLNDGIALGKVALYLEPIPRLSNLQLQL